MKFSLASLCNCVKRLHPDLKQRVGSDTLKKYEKSLDSFTMYLHRLPDWSTFSCEDIDLLVMEFRTEMDLTKSQHITLVAALEFFLPNLKGNLVVCREALKGRANAEPTKHTVPLTTELALLFGAYMASKGKLKLGAAMILQQCTGLRPSELLALQQDHIYVSPDCKQPITIRLGAVVSTKVKREQFVLLSPVKNPLASALLRKFHAESVVGARLFPFSYSIYNSSFKQCEQHYQLQLGFTAHSPRAGFATSQVISGTPVKDTQAAGRWMCEASFQTYVDVVAAAHIRAQVGSKALDDTVLWVKSRSHLYFDLPQQHVSSVQDSVSGPQTGLPLQVGERHDSRSAGTLVHASETTMEDREVGRNLGRRASKGSGKTYGQTSAFTKGKGRGQLIRRRPQTKEMD